MPTGGCSICIVFAAIATYFIVSYALDFGDNGNWVFTDADTALKKALKDGGSVENKIVLVTGCRFKGIGYETARHLAKAGAIVYVHMRTIEQSVETIAMLHKENSNYRLRPAAAELTDLQAVVALADEITKTDEPLDILILNAGVAWIEDFRTAAGFEFTMAINYFSQALLALKLLPALQRAAAPRVITLSSGAATGSDGSFIDLPNFSLAVDKYSSMQSYCDSKLADVLLAGALSRHFDLDAVAVDPGLVDTNVLKNAQQGSGMFPRGMALLGQLFAKFIKTPSQGAATTVHAAVTPQLVRGGVYANGHLSYLIGPAATVAADEKRIDLFFERTKEFLKDYL